MSVILKKRPIRKKKNKTPKLEGCPQKRVICVKLLLLSPKKPNSAVRKAARVKYSKDPLGKNIEVFTTAYIPGIGHNLQKHSTALMRGGRVQDLPGVRYKLIRGGKYDLYHVVARMNGRSKYGSKKIWK